MKRGSAKTEIWRALYATAAHRMAEGKWVVAIDEDIDPDDANAIFWAMSYRCKPHRDTHMLPHKHEGHGPRSMIDSEDSCSSNRCNFERGPAASRAAKTAVYGKSSRDLEGIRFARNKTRTTMVWL